jgi:hypothetical protein
MVRRRDALALLGALPFGRGRGVASAGLAGGIEGPATMIVAGPDGGRVDRIAAVLAPLLARGLAPGTQIRRKGTGGLDGVTAANQFTARAAPDGETVLLVPGAAALAWLTGDTRAHFDTAAWVPVLAGLSSGVVAGRLPANGITTGTRLRLAADLTAAELPALLAIDLLGATVVPVHGVHGDAALSDAFSDGKVDLVFLRERAVRARLAEMQRAGATPLFSLGAAVEGGGLTRDPILPDLPAFPEYFAQTRGVDPAGALYDAWRAAAVASQLEFALVLPQLTPGAKVAIWRQAAAGAADTVGWYPPGVLRILPPAVATAWVAATAADAPAQLELRRWMAERFDWRPV